MFEKRILDGRFLQNIGFPVIIALLTISIYINTLGNGFTFDDFHKILNNTVVTNPDWSDPVGFYVPPNSVRPHPDRAIPQMMFAAEYAIWEARPLGYHAVNVLLQSLVCVLLYFVVLQLLPNRKRLAAVTAALFAAHPIHTDVVASVIGRGELMSSLCFFAAFLIYLHSTDSEERGWSYLYGLSLPLLLIGALSKETASWTLPFAVAAADIVRFGIARRRSFREYVPVFGRRLVRFYLPYIFLLSGLSIYAWKHMSVPEVSANYLVFLAPAPRILAALGIFMRYLVLLAWPFRLSCDYSFNQLTYQGVFAQGLWVAGGVAFAAGLGVLFFRSLRKEGAYFFALFVFAVNYGIISNILVVINVAMAERLLYAASWGYCLFVALLFERLFERRRTVACVILAIILIAFSARTFTRNRDWKDNFTLFSSSYTVCPMSSRLNFNLGVEYAERGELDKAVFHYRKSVESIPWHPAYHLNLGEAYSRQGVLDQAVASFRKTVRLAPEEPGGYINLGGALVEQGQYEEAYRALSVALALSPNEWQVHYNMGLAGMAKGFQQKAVACFEKTVLLNPEQDGAWHRLGVAALQAGNPQQALSYLEKAISLNPAYKEACNNLGLACIQLGQVGRAEVAFRQALSIDPDFVLASENLHRLMLQKARSGRFGGGQ